MNSSIADRYRWTLLRTGCWWTVVINPNSNPSLSEIHASCDWVSSRDKRTIDMCSLAKMTYGCTSTSACNAGLLGPSLADMCNSSKFIVFMTILNELVRSNDKISGRCERVKPIEEPDEEYDFVVIGGGGAGAVVAGRLTENPDWDVLLMEAGPDEPAGAEIPQVMLTLMHTEVDWNFTTMNEGCACLSNGGSCRLSSGKMLGGNTAHNGMTYNRGNPTDYDKWAKRGNAGWTWEEVKRFYLLAEDNGEIERVGRFHHATGGPLHVERFPYIPPFGHSCLAAAVEVGYGLSKDLNGKKFTGFSVAQTTSKKGVRVSSASAYLRPVRNRRNLHVSLNSQATRLIIKDHKAVGVVYYKNGQLKTVRVSKEVVVSAGTIMSPHLLLLSGIGPKQHLQSVGVNVVKDLPGVGRNFQDHFTYMLSFTINEPDEYDNDYDIAAEYLANQTGPLSAVGLGQVMGTLKTKAASPDYPDLQVYFGGYSTSCAPGEVGALSSTGKRTLFIRAVNLRPRSRGRITLASKDPLEYPRIQGNYLSDPADVDGVVEAIELGLAMAETKALRAHNFTLSTTPIEACSHHHFKSKKYWACAVRHDGGPELHMAGSCKMGPKSDPMAVVDHRLRVHGVKGLRVADASIMPQVTSGNTAAPAMMIGERAADFIKKDWCW